MMDILATATQKSIELLKQNSLGYGFRAAAENEQKPEYTYLFGRDGSICAFSLLEFPDADLVATAVRSLESLKNARSKLGQVPFRTDLSSGYRDFWFPGNLDSTLWWALAATKLVQFRPKLKAEWQSDIELSLQWLRYQDVAETGLLMQGQRSDWADELPNHGAVLYTNALWYKVVTEAISTFGSSDLLNMAYQEQIYQSFQEVFWPYEGSKRTGSKQMMENKALNRAVEWAKVELVRQPYYISYLSRRSYGRRCDVFGNLLALMFGLADGQKQQEITKYLWSIQASQPYPVKCLHPSIYPGEVDWQEGMASRNQNVPHQYHNGGIWPFIGGFWVYYLATLAQTPARFEQCYVATQPGAHLRSAQQVVHDELVKLAQANALNNWEFNEYLHGQFGTPMGIPHQSWNAATYLLAHQAAVHHQFALEAREIGVKRPTKPLTNESLTPQLLQKVQRKFTPMKSGFTVHD